MQYQNSFSLTDVCLVGEDLLVSSRDGIVSFMQKTTNGYENNTFVSHMSKPPQVNIYLNSISNEEKDKLLDTIDYVCCIKIVDLEDETIIKNIESQT